jgi:hypothetical protein
MRGLNIKTRLRLCGYCEPNSCKEKERNNRRTSLYKGRVRLEVEIGQNVSGLITSPRID